MDKENVFIGMRLEEIKSIVKDNGRNIADNSLRLMSLTDDIKEVKEDIKCMLDIIADTQKNVDLLIDINLEMKKESLKRDLIMNDILGYLRETREIMDRWKIEDELYQKAGSM